METGSDEGKVPKRTGVEVLKERGSTMHIDVNTVYV